MTPSGICSRFYQFDATIFIILEQREMIKRNTLATRKQMHYGEQLNQMG